MGGWWVVLVYSLGLLRFTQTALVIVTDDPLCCLGPELASRTNDPVLSTVIHICHVVFEVVSEGRRGRREGGREGRNRW